jgi:hypothetical protein
MTLDTSDWQELYEGACEVFGPARAAIFMRSLEPGMRQDLATKADVESGLDRLRADFEAKLRGLTRTIATMMLATIGAVLGITGLT